MMNYKGNYSEMDSENLCIINEKDNNNINDNNEILNQLEIKKIWVN